MKIPSVVSRTAAIVEAADYVSAKPKAQVVPLCLFLHNGIGCLQMSCEEGKDSDRMVLFPLVSSAGNISKDFSEYPQMNKMYLQDRVDFVQFIDREVGGAPACASLLTEDELKTYYITVPSKGVSAIIPATLVQKSAIVRLLLEALPAELPELYKGLFEEITKSIIDKNKAK